MQKWKHWKIIQSFFHLSILQSFNSFIMKAKTVIKFIILVAIFYALLAFNVFHIGEKLVPTTKDYLEMNIPPQDKDLEENYLENEPMIQTGHGAANNDNDLKSLCESINICNKIVFQWNFLDTEKYTYTKIISKVVQFIDDNGNQNNNIKDVINTIEVSKENGDRRGYATRDSIIFNIWSVKSNKEFIELTTHEMGHITDLGYIQWISSQKDKKYTEFGKVVFATDDLSLSFYKLSRDSETIRKAEAKKKDFCSGYGMSDPFEDFAECFNLYTNHNSFFKQIGKVNTVLKKKYNFIASIFNGQYINTNNKDLLQIKDNPTRRPRDTTKLVNN